jgi:hypothetical protein
VKTVPTVRVVDSTDAVVLPDLPEEIALAMSDIAGAAREGLLAMSVAAGLAVMQTMFEAEPTEACGPKGIHDPDRVAVRHGTFRRIKGHKQMPRLTEALRRHAHAGAASVGAAA